MTKIKNLTTIGALLIGLLSVKAQVSGTFTIGPGADYETLTAAFSGLQSAGGINGDVILELQSDYATTDLATLGYVAGSLTYFTTIRPASDVTDLQINHDFRINGSDNIIFDGSNPITGDKVVQINGEIRMYTHVRNSTFKNLKINIQGRYGIYGSNAGAVSGAQYWDDITISDCEFFAESPIDLNDHVYAVYSYTTSGPQSGFPNNIVVENNKFYGLNRTNQVGLITCIFVNTGLKAYNNSLSHEFTAYENRFNGISASYDGNNEIIHNSISVRGGSTSNDAYISAISLSSTTAGGKVLNNIISINSSGSSASSKQAINADKSLVSLGYNNVYIYDDGISETRYINSYTTIQEASAYSPSLTFSEPSFVNPSIGDLTLSASSETNPEFRAIANTTITTDHNGNLRNSQVPSKGAFEASNRIADITVFTHANKYEDAVIINTNSTVLLEVTNGTDLTSLNPSIGVYVGASIDPNGIARDFTTPQDYTVTAEDGTTTEVWTATIVHQNDTPTDILLSSTDIDENSSIGTVAGTFSTEDVDADSHTYSLVAGAGDIDNSAFLINGNALELNTSLDYESKNSYSIRVMTDDNVSYGGTFEKVFTITINDLPDEAPTAIYLDNDMVVEGAPIGTVVGMLSTQDIDVVDDHVYTLVSGTGDEGNALFDIVDDKLVTATSFDFLDGSSYSVLIRTTDNGGASLDQSFIINIKEVNDGPQGSAASSEYKITPDARYSYSYFGEDIAISNGYAFVGAHAHDYDENEENWVRDAGAAFVFEKDEVGSWSQTQKLVRPSNRSSYDNFGKILAIDGDYAAIAMPYEEGTSTGFSDGIILMYEKNESGTWEYRQELTPSGSNDDGIEFGYDVDLAGDYLVASALYDAYDENGENYHSDAGAAYIFKRNASGVWEEVQKIVASDRTTYGSYYGESVAITNGYIAIGAPEANSLAEDGLTLLEQTGAVYMYEENESGEWTEVAKLVASDRLEYEYLGYNIDIDGETLIIGNNEKYVEGVSWAGQVYVFERSEAGIWSETGKLTADVLIEDGEFGRSVSISGNNIAVGAYYVDPTADGSGVYIFSKSGNEWIQSDIITPAFYDNNSDFGNYISLDGDDIIASDIYANLDSDGANPMTNSGAAYIFGLCNNPDLPTIEASENQTCDGTTVTLSIGDAELNDALTWEWYSESCGGTPIGSGSSIDVSPSATTTYYVRGEGACSSSTTCSFITVEVYELCPQNDILTFSLEEQTSDAVIDPINHTVGTEVEIGTDVTALTPVITVSKGATYSPTGAQDFTNTVVYTVTAEDGSAQEWNISVIVGENTAPTLETAFQDLSEEEGFGSVQVSYAGAFADADGHALNISVESSDTDVVTVAVAANNNIQITEVGVGTSAITVTASDGFGGSVTDEFTFTITEAPNNAPSVANPIADESLEEGFESTIVNLTNVFADQDGDVLTYNATSSNSSVATVAISETTLTITEVGIGTATITVTAADGNGGSVSDEFTFTITEAPLGFEDELTVKVYPNPTTDFVFIESSEDTMVHLNDLNGRSIQSSKGRIVQMDVRSLRSGTYFLRISRGKTTTIKRIIKAN